MCHKLTQTYACGHSKDICTTPCPHALSTGTRIPNAKHDKHVSRSSSVVSSIAPSIRREEIPSQLRSLPPQQPNSSQNRAQHTPPPPLRYIQTPPLGPPPGFPSAVQVARPSDPPSPTLSPAPSPSTRRLPDEENIIEPKFCPYHFPHHLPQSNHPCIECYFLPPWAHLAERYVKSYREGHPVNKPEDAEKLSGIERLSEEYKMRQSQNQSQRRKQSGGVGLLNVFVDGNEDAGRVG